MILDSCHKNFPNKVTRDCMKVIKERHINTYKRRTLISRKHKDFGHLFFSRTLITDIHLEIQNVCTAILHNFFQT